ncbi:MAG: beta-lactamase family protein [Acidobacteria bacterium]|nr:beta-lactamase family protein [Acidobacteriota bacterium]
MTRRELLAAASITLQPTAEQALRKPEAAVLLVRKGKEITLKAFGAAKTDSKFLIASITKPFTVAAFLWVAERNRIPLTDPVVKYLPGFSSPTMQLSHLLNHTSGLPDMLPENAELRRRHAPLSEFQKLTLTTLRLFEAGQKYSYSSMAILLASAIASKVDSRPFAKLIDEVVFRPLGMNATMLGKVPGAVRSQTEFATGQEPAWDWNSDYWRGLGAPWGGAHSTAEDIAKFLQAFLNPASNPLGETLAKSMVRPGGFGFKHGKSLSAKLPERAFGHGGSTGTLCWANPEKDQIFVLLTSLPDEVSRKTVIQPVSDSVIASLQP